MADEKITLQDSTPINVTVQAAGAPGPPLAPRSVELTVPASGIIPELGTLNSWTLTAARNLVLPAVPDGFQTTVKITGYQHVTWPGGTVVYGSSAANEVYVTIARHPGQWVVLVPNNEPLALNIDSLRDTGWITHVSGSVFGGVATYSVGSAADHSPITSQSVADGSNHHPPIYGPNLADAKGGFSISYRRMGNRAYMRVAGFTRTTNSVETGTNGYMLCQLPPIVGHRGTGTGTVSQDIATKHAPAPPGSTGYGPPGARGVGTVVFSMNTFFSGGSGAVGRPCNVFLHGLDTGEVLGDTSQQASGAGPIEVSWFVEGPWPEA